MSQVADPPL